MKTKVSSALAILLGVCAAWSRAFVARGSESYVFVKMWPSPWAQFDRSGTVAVDTSGNVYAADTDNHRIQKFRPSFPVHQVGYGPAGLTVVWSSVPGKRCQILHSPDLAAWSVLPTIIESVGEFTQWTDDAVTEIRQRFYKIELLP